VQKAQEAEMEAEMEKAFTNHKPFKTAKQIRAEKYGVDEDEEGTGRTVFLTHLQIVNFDCSNRP
jgi:hypothetical protein